MYYREVNLTYSYHRNVLKSYACFVSRCILHWFSASTLLLCSSALGSSFELFLGLAGLVWMSHLLSYAHQNIVVFLNGIKKEWHDMAGTLNCCWNVYSINWWELYKFSVNDASFLKSSKNSFRVHLINVCLMFKFNRTLFFVSW